MSFQIIIECEDVDEMRMYLNAKNYYNLLCDFNNQMKLALKHDGDIVDVVESFSADFHTAIEHHNGPY